MSETVDVKFAFNPKTQEYDLISCEGCSALVLPQSYPRHLKTEKHLRGVPKWTNVSGVKEQRKTGVIQVSSGPVRVSF